MTRLNRQMPLMVFIFISGNFVQPLVKNNRGGLIVDGLVVIGIMIAFSLYRAVALVFPNHGIPYRPST